MNANPSSRNGKTRHLRVVAVLLLWSVAAIGQQSMVPGATSLETEAEEEVRRYSVELIIFEYLNRSSAGTEVFDPDLPPESAEEELYFSDETLDLSIETDPYAARESASGEVFFEENDVENLPPVVDEDVALEQIQTFESAGLKLHAPEDYVLQDAYERLQNLDAYRPLMHVGWTQPTLEKDLTMPIKLRRLGNPPLRLNGTVTLYLSRFLHLVLDLALEEQAPMRVPPANDRFRGFGDDRSRFRFDSQFITPSIFYRIEEDRIVRNGELRYYDHPRFGVLAKIARIEEEDPVDGVDSADFFATPSSGQN